jgi:hypothetical protein
MKMFKFYFSATVIEVPEVVEVETNEPERTGADPVKRDGEFQERLVKILEKAQASGMAIDPPSPPAEGHIAQTFDMAAASIEEAMANLKRLSDVANQIGMPSARGLGRHRVYPAFPLG